MKFLTSHENAGDTTAIVISSNECKIVELRRCWHWVDVKINIVDFIEQPKKYICNSELEKEDISLRKISEIGIWETLLVKYYVRYEELIRSVTPTTLSAILYHRYFGIGKSYDSLTAMNVVHLRVTIEWEGEREDVIVRRHAWLFRPSETRRISGERAPSFLRPWAFLRECVRVEAENCR